MALITRDSVERVREAVDMVELVGQKTDLRRAGARWMGRCPFHDDRSPSFSVNAQERLYYCFGCEAKGDAIRFVEETEALDFPAAVELLAERYGVELVHEEEDSEAEARRRRRERLLALLDRTGRFYATFLWQADEAAVAREHLLGRGLSEAVLRDFSVGYAPSGWDRLVKAALRDGYGEDELVATGLAQRGRRGLIDRFRERITFPLADGRGRVRGFGARAVKADQQPKYLNSAEGELFHKGRQLFGIDRARAAAARKERIVVVEGYTDALALHAAGIGETVAIMGTALTREQLEELSRAAPRVLLALDADPSGQEAMRRARRAADELRRGGRALELEVVELPRGQDPADLLAADGLGELAARLERPISAAEFEVRRALDDEDLSTPSGRDRALARVAPVISEVPHDHPNTHAHLVRYVSDRLDLPVQSVTAQLSPAHRAPKAPAPADPPRPSVAPGERDFLAACLTAGAIGREYLARLSDEHLSSPAAGRLRAHLLGHFDDPVSALSNADSELVAMVAEVSARSERLEPKSEEDLRTSFMVFDGARIEAELRQAEREGNLARKEELARAKHELRAT